MLRKANGFPKLSTLLPRGVIVKPGLWTLDWIVDCDMVSYMDCT